MGTKKETKITDIINIISPTNEEVTQNAVEIVPIDFTNYIKIKHPFIKKQNIYAKIPDLFIVYNLLIEINKLILEKGILDEELRDKINQFIMIIKLIDSYNGIDKKYNYYIKNKTLYIL